VEQYWRDNRLNMIHEGTHGIQGLDLLGRKVVMQEGAGLALLARTVGATVERAKAVPTLAAHAAALATALAELGAATKAAWATGNPDEALANATPYLQAFGHTVLAWVWLDVALCAQARLAEPGSDPALLRGKLAACTYFFHYELPRIGAWLKVVETRDATCRTMDETWF
jgi:butyryl-CoA dehydrogenase